MNAYQWARHWARLVRQEAELSQGSQQDGKQSAPGSARGPAAPAGQAQQLRAHLDRQLATLEALCAQGTAAEEAPALDRRRLQVGAALAQLATASAAQLQELDELEVQLRQEYEEAAKGARQLLVGGNAAAAQQQGSVLDATAQQQPRPGADRPAAPVAEKVSSSLPPEVTAHDTFLQRHGPTGGWHPDDHAEFERILRACRGSHAHAARLCAEQLGLLHSAADIAAHARWHEEVQRLAVAKRLAVQRWRLARHAEQAALLERVQAAGDDACDNNPQGQGLQTSRQKRRQQQEEQRAAVAEWRAVREQEQHEALQRQAAEEREQRRREAAALQERQQENRQLLERRAEEREANSRARKEGQLTAESSGGSGADRACTGAPSASSLADPTARQRLRDRNQQLLERRVAAARRRSQQAAEQAQRMEQLARRASEQCQFGAGVERDPSRLLRATSAAALRTLAVLSEERGPRDSGFIRHLPRRAAPSWCSGARLQ